MLKVYVSTSDDRFTKVADDEWWDAGEDGTGLDLVDGIEVDVYLEMNPEIGIIIRKEEFLN